MNSISAIASFTSPAPSASSLLHAPADASNGASGAASPFGDLLKDAVGSVNALESQAHTAVTGLMTGTGVDVHQAMIATEKADMAFELALSVRNKAVQAYQSVMGMQF